MSHQIGPLPSDIFPNNVHIRDIQVFSSRDYNRWLLLLKLVPGKSRYWPPPLFLVLVYPSPRSLSLKSVTYLHIIGFRAKHINPMHCNGVLKVLPFYSSEDSQALSPLPQFQSNCFFSGRAFCGNVHFHCLYFNNTVLSTNITFTYFLWKKEGASL